MPRLYREAPLLSIWEGSGNVAALDLLRALAKTPGAADAFLTEVDAAADADARLDAAVARVRGLLGQLSDPVRAQVLARRLAEQMTLVLEGALLVRHGDPAVADAFCASRLDGDWGHAFGTLPLGADTRAIIERAVPKDAH